MIAAPQIVGLNDTILRSLRDEPGFWWATYRRAWKRNVKASLLPGAVCGLLLAMEIFTAFHLDTSQSVVPAGGRAGGADSAGGHCTVHLCPGGAGRGQLWRPAEKRADAVLGYLPRSALGVLWQGIYWAAVALFWPVSSFAVILCSLWLPCL